MSDSSALRRLARTPVLGRLLMIPFRARVGLGYASIPASRLARWLFTSREYTNFTYHLDPLNEQYLAAFIAQIAGADHETVATYFHEVKTDEVLKAHIRGLIVSSEEGRFADSEIAYGRRIGWYAFVRLLKPSVVVETGVDKGLGACVLCAALLRNAAEGHPGRYYGTDINPHAGYLLQGTYAEVGEVLYGDSITSIRDLDSPIDLFINDSDHSAEYERREYEAVAPRLTDAALIIGDNAHVTGELLGFARRSGRRFLFFQEKPDRHWYPGAGIGVAFPDSFTESA